MTDSTPVLDVPPVACGQDDLYHSSPHFNLIQRALVLEDYAPALGVAGFVTSRKKGARSKGK